jgi:hypothetical protein
MRVGCQHSGSHRLFSRSARATRLLQETQRNGNVPRNLLDDLTDEGGPLAQVALCPGDLGLDDSGSGFLSFVGKHVSQRPSSGPLLPSLAKGLTETATRDTPRVETVADSLLGINVHGPC